ncbi:MAG: DUF3460 family protein [Burkholderiales bacterium]|jgi:hypothetical protein|nr:DUF3460 family protein [Burkholderiales bacterium]
MYESDLTKFMRDLFRKKPYLAEAQREARAIWWDKKVDFGELKRMQESRVPVRGYVYYPLIKSQGDCSSAEPAAPGAAET